MIASETGRLPILFGSVLVLACRNFCGTSFGCSRTNSHHCRFHTARLRTHVGTTGSTWRLCGRIARPARFAKSFFSRGRDKRPIFISSARFVDFPCGLSAVFPVAKMAGLFGRKQILSQRFHAPKIYRDNARHFRRNFDDSRSDGNACGFGSNGGCARRGKESDIF